MATRNTPGSRAAVRLATTPRPRIGRARVTGLLLALVPLLAACSVGVPDPAAPRPTGSAAPTLATPTVTPGYDADAVAARNLPLAAGDRLAAGVPVQLSDGLHDAPRWKTSKQAVAGATEYRKADGCVVDAKVRVNQWPLAVAGDDKASTEALFHYLDPTIQPAYLKTATLRWGGQPDKPAPKVEVLVFEDGKKAGSRATASYARLFAKAGSSVYISVSCPGPAALAAARADVAARLAVVPPSS